MPFDVPTIQTLITRVTADMNSRFSGVYNTLRRRVTAVLARVIAGVAYGLYGYQTWVSRQILPDTMDEDSLLRYGAIMGVPYRLAAKAAGLIAVTGTDGSTVPVGAKYQRDDGVEYTVTAAAVISAGVADVAVAGADYGANWNAAEGAVVTAVSPVPGVASSAVVGTGGITDGADAMDIDTYRAMVIERCGTYFTGANAAVYERWAKEVSGVTRAWCYEATPDPGSVAVLFVVDDDPDGIIPDAAQIAAVEDYIEEHTDPLTGQVVGRAVNVTVVVGPPVPHTVDFTLGVSPDTAETRAAVEAELTDLLRAEAVPGGVIYLSRIRAAVSSAAGVYDFTMSVPAADVAPDPFNMAMMGTITWV